jgi:hypothetical protein
MITQVDGQWHLQSGERDAEPESVEQCFAAAACSQGVPSTQLEFQAIHK